MDYTSVFRNLVYHDLSLDGLMDLNELNEALIDNMNKISWLREGDFEKTARSCLNTAYYICMVMRQTRKPAYKLQWYYDTAKGGRSGDSLQQMVTMALVLLLIDHGNQEWRGKNLGMIEQIVQDMSKVLAVRHDDTYGLPIPQGLEFQPILGVLKKDLPKDVTLDDALFQPLPILEGIRNVLMPELLAGDTGYIVKQIRQLSDRDVQQQCVDEFMRRFKLIVVNNWELKGIFNTMIALCEELGLEKPEKLLEYEAEQEETDEDDEEEEIAETGETEEQMAQHQKLLAEIDNLKKEVERQKQEHKEMIIELLTDICIDKNKDYGLELYDKISKVSSEDIPFVITQFKKAGKIHKSRSNHDIWIVLHAAKLYDKSTQNFDTTLRRLS